MPFDKRSSNPTLQARFRQMYPDLAVEYEQDLRQDLTDHQIDEIIASEVAWDEEAAEREILRDQQMEDAKYLDATLNDQAEWDDGDIIGDDCDDEIQPQRRRQRRYRRRECDSGFDEYCGVIEDDCDDGGTPAIPPIRSSMNGSLKANSKWEAYHSSDYAKTPVVEYKNSDKKHQEDRDLINSLVAPRLGDFLASPDGHSPGTQGHELWVLREETARLKEALKKSEQNNLDLSAECRSYLQSYNSMSELYNQSETRYNQLYSDTKTAGTFTYVSRLESLRQRVKQLNEKLEEKPGDLNIVFLEERVKKLEDAIIQYAKKHPYAEKLLGAVRESQKAMDDRASLDQI